MQVHSKKQAHVRALLFDKTSTKVLAEYSNYNDIFLLENTAEFPENIGINKHAIKLKKNKQSSFGPIYSLEPIELETLKTYIKTNLANGFIWSSKFFAGVSIFFNKKSKKSLHLYIDYWSLNNIFIKNQYLLPLIGELLDWLN